MIKRIALAGIYHESNTFLPDKTTWKDFEKGHLFYGEAIRKEYQAAYHEIGGILEVFDQTDVEIVPLFFAEATPAGMITADSYEKLVAELSSALKENEPWDGAMFCIHGAAVAENHPDMDGDWLAMARTILGPDIPIVCTMDPHGNVSEKMIAVTNAIVAYSTNPHLDQRDTGKKAARLMLDHLAGNVRLHQSFARSRVSISIEQQATSEYPCTLLYDKARILMGNPDVLSVSIVLGFPYADVPEMASSFIALTHNNSELGEQVVEQMRITLEDNRHAFVGDRTDARTAAAMARNLPTPVLLLDMGDNVGGGSPGDSTFLLQALKDFPELKYFVCLYDPVAVSLCELKGIKARITLEAGGKTDRTRDIPYSVSGQIGYVGSGKFRENEVRHGGQTNYNMGRIAILHTDNGSTLMLSSRRMPPFSLRQLTTFGIDPELYDVIIAKGVQAPIAAYAEVCSSMIRVNTPGLTCADATQLPYRNRTKPLFPFEDWGYSSNDPSQHGMRAKLH